MRLINAEEFSKDLLEKSRKVGFPKLELQPCEYGYKLGLERAIMSAITFPTVDKEPVRHGHWIKVFPRHMNRNATYKCSVCKKLRSSYYNDVAEWEHCPCGAKMDGKENKE